MARTRPIPTVNLDLPAFQKMLEERRDSLTDQITERTKERNAQIKHWPNEIRGVLTQIRKNLDFHVEDPLLPLPAKPQAPEHDYLVRQWREEVTRIEADLKTLKLIKDETLRVTPSSRWQRYV